MTCPGHHPPPAEKMKIPGLSLALIILQLESLGSSSSLPLRCLEYVYESNVQVGAVLYVLRDPLLDDRFYQLAMSRGNILLGSLDGVQHSLNWGFLHEFEPPKHYVLVSRGLGELDRQLQFLGNSSEYSSRVGFMVMFLDEIDGERCAHQSRRVASIFEHFWRYYLHNTLVIYCPRGERSVMCLVYTWFPYGKYSSCAKNFFNYEQIDRCFDRTPNDTNDESEVKKASTLFVQYLSKNITEYVFKFPPQANDTTEPTTDSSETDDAMKNAFSSEGNDTTIILLNGDENYDENGTVFVNNGQLPAGSGFPWPDVDDPCANHTPNEAFFTWTRIAEGSFEAPLRKPKASGSGTFELRSQRESESKLEYETDVNQFVEEALMKRPTDFSPAESDLISGESPHFFHKVPADLKGCRVRALMAIWPPHVTNPTTTDWIGMEHKLVLDVARFMNFRLVEEYLDVNASSKMGRVEVMRELRSHNAELFFGNLYPHFERHEEFDHSVGYLYDIIDWVVPLAEKQPLWMNLASAFSLPLWICIIVTHVTFTAVYEPITTLVESLRTRHQALEVIGILLAMSLPRLPKTNLCRLLFALWSLYCIHISIFYQSKMIDILTEPPSQKQISNLEELLDSGLEVAFPDNFAIHLERLNNSDIDAILRRKVECTSETCLVMVQSGRYATIGNRLYVRYMAVNSNVPIRYYLFKEFVAKSFVQIVMQKGLPLRDHINKKIRAMVQAGYITAVKGIFLAQTGNPYLHKQPPSTNALKLQHYQGAFLILAIGCALSSLIFVIELLRNKQKRHRASHPKPIKPFTN